MTRRDLFKACAAVLIGTNVPKAKAVTLVVTVNAEGLSRLVRDFRVLLDESHANNARLLQSLLKFERRA